MSLALSLTNSLFFLSIILASTLVVGLSFERLFRFREALTVRLTLCFSLGLTLLLVVVYALSYLLISWVVLGFAVLICGLAFLWTCRGSLASFHVAGPSSLVADGAHLTVMALMLLYMGWVLDYTRWPPTGDVLIEHAPRVTLLMFDGKLFSNLLPIVNSTSFAFGQFYPMGFHTLVASFDTAFALYPAEAVYLFGAFGMFALVALAFAIVYVNTKSVALSVIGSMLMFLFHPSGNLARWLFGFFWNGPYPNLYGYVILFSYVLYLSIWENEHRSLNELLVLTSIYSAGIFVTYPSFVAFPVLLVTILSIMRLGVRSKPAWGVIGTVFGGLGVIFLLFRESVVSVISDLQRTAFGYQIKPEFFYDAAMMLPALPVIILSAFVAVKRRSAVALFVLIVGASAALSALFPNNPYSAFILPDRSLTLYVFLAWIFVLICIPPAWKYSRPLAAHVDGGSLVPGFATTERFRRRLVIVGACGIVAIVAIAVLPPYLVAQPTAWGWFGASPSFRTDFVALEWIAHNIKPGGLILNDASFSSQYLLGLAPETIVYHRWTASIFRSPALNQRAMDLFHVWQQPNDTLQNAVLLRRYNVSYIFVDTEWSYWSEEEIFGTNWSLVAKPFSPQQYATFFGSYQFLNEVFSFNGTAVYRVDQITLSSYLATP